MVHFSSPTVLQKCDKENEFNGGSITITNTNTNTNTNTFIIYDRNTATTNKKNQNSHTNDENLRNVQTLKMHRLSTNCQQSIGCDVVEVDIIDEADNDFHDDGEDDNNKHNINCNLSVQESNAATSPKDTTRILGRNESLQTNTTDISHRYKLTSRSDENIFGINNIFEYNTNQRSDSMNNKRSQQFSQQHQNRHLSSNRRINNNFYDKKQLKLLNITTKIALTSFLAMMSSFIYQLIWLLGLQMNNGHLLWFSYSWCLDGVINIICIYLQLGIAKSLYKKLCISSCCKCHQCTFKIIQCITKKRTEWNRNATNLCVQVNNLSSNSLNHENIEQINNMITDITSPKYQHNPSTHMSR